MEISVLRSKRVMFRTLPPLLYLTISALACSVSDSHPSLLPDYDNSDGFILDYSSGDRFETLKPMFLTRPTGQGLDLAQPGVGAPSLEQYATDPGRFPYVVKLVPATTSLELVGLKAGYSTSLTFVTMPGVDEWISVGLGEHTKDGERNHKRYNREYFRKIEPTNAPPAAANDR